MKSIDFSNNIEVKVKMIDLISIGWRFEEGIECYKDEFHVCVSIHNGSCGLCVIDNDDLESMYYTTQKSENINITNDLNFLYQQGLLWDVATYEWPSGKKHLL